MESSAFSDIYGGEIQLERHSYSDTCREFTITHAKLSLRSVTVWSCVVWLVAYGLFLYVQHSGVLSAAILITVLGLLLHLHLVKIDEESLLLLGSLGLQQSVRYASGRESSVFLEMCRVHDVVIHEAICMQRVHYYLCVLLRDPAHPQRPAQLIPAFRGAQPRLDCLMEIYRSCQEVLARRREAEEGLHGDARDVTSELKDAGDIVAKDLPKSVAKMHLADDAWLFVSP